MVGKVFEKYLVKKKLSINLSLMAKAETHEKADKKVENFVKEVFEKFVKKLVSDKIVDSYDNYELTTILLTQVVDVDETPTFEESYKKLVGIDKK